ncbi:unnamed protein product [Parnassius apollo]|uniref:(apollo) hypothetical protein n=1 Tax=Parnassius apollo TaxID=110799 RepID=A0A8S3W4N1_PARAO|nr:unnamed protein product [Parnassius apollo]
MDVHMVKGLLETIQNAMVLNKRYDNVAATIFDPDKSNNGAAAWCESFDKLGDELKWCSFEKVAKAVRPFGALYYPSLTRGNLRRKDERRMR